ncbi:hypothetical protein LCGC14_1948880, partial [marine sediment metagenome]
MAQAQTITESQKETKALQIADRTGVSDVFAYQNFAELTDSFAIADPSDIEVLMDEPIVFPEPPEIPRTIGPASSGKQKGLFERMFGYDANMDLPWGYGRMSPFQRVVFKADLQAQNLFTRVGLGATKQLKGTLELLLPKSIEQYLPTDTRLNPFRLEEDTFYEKRIQKELRRSKKQGTLSIEGEDQLAYLDGVLPSTTQRGPEFVGRVAAIIEEYALATEVFKLIPGPKGRTLANTLSRNGKQLLGNRIRAAGFVASSKTKKAALSSLAKAISNLGPDAGSLFLWGFAAREKEEGEAAAEVFIGRSIQ